MILTLQFCLQSTCPAHTAMSSLAPEGIVTIVVWAARAL